MSSLSSLSSKLRAKPTPESDDSQPALAKKQKVEEPKETVEEEKKEEEKKEEEKVEEKPEEKKEEEEKEEEEEDEKEDEKEEANPFRKALSFLRDRDFDTIDTVYRHVFVERNESFVKTHSQLTALHDPDALSQEQKAQLAKSMFFRGWKAAIKLSRLEAPASLKTLPNLFNELCPLLVGAYELFESLQHVRADERANCKEYEEYTSLINRFSKKAKQLFPTDSDEEKRATIDEIKRHLLAIGRKFLNNKKKEVTFGISKSLVQSFLPDDAEDNFHFDLNVPDSKEEAAQFCDTLLLLDFPLWPKFKLANSRLREMASEAWMSHMPAEGAPKSVLGAMFVVYIKQLLAATGVKVQNEGVLSEFVELTDNRVVEGANKVIIEIIAVAKACALEHNLYCQ